MPRPRARNAEVALSANDRPDVTRSPVPRFDLLRIDAYQSIGVQFSRGCPFNCEFCDIIEVFGRVPRTKPPEQMLREFDAIYATGFRGMLFMVDDNFIGNKRAAKHMLPSARRLDAGQATTRSTCTRKPR